MPAEVTDADAQAAYEKIAGKDPQFGAPEKRDLQQILFPNEADAAAAEAKLKAGASFDDLVKERGLKPEDTDIGETTKDAMLDKDEANAVFALPQGGVSGVLKSQFGPVIVRVKGITPSTVKPYAEVADAGEEAGLRFPRRRQDPGPARQDRGRAGVRQNHPRSREGGGLDRANDRRRRRCGPRPQRRAGQPAGPGRTVALRLRVRRRAGRGAAEHQGRRLRLV